MTERALISVVIPAYNVEKYIVDAVQSVLSQPRKDVQVVCVNDGSTDATLSLLHDLGSGNPRVHIIDQPNAGISATRNTGIEYVLANIDCDYIMFLDSDDIWHRDWLTEDIQNVFAEQHDVIAFDFCRADAELRRRGPSMHTYTGLLPGGDRAVQVDHQHMCASAYRTGFIQKTEIRFHAGQKLAEDIDFTLEARTLAETVCFCEKLVYIYRIRPGSIIQNGTPAITYYTTLFDGWIRSHEFLLTKGIESGCTYGAIKWYFDDFVKEVFRQHGNRKELLAVLEKYAFCMDGEGTDKQKVEAYLSKFSKRFELRENLVGIANQIKALVKRLPIVQTLIDRKYYPYALK